MLDRTAPPHPLSRRRFAALAAAAAAAGPLHAVAQTVSQPPGTSGQPGISGQPGTSSPPGDLSKTKLPTLREMASARRLLAGCAVKVRLLRSMPAYADLVRAQAGIIVEESAMKFGPLRPSPTTFFWDDADYFVDFGEKNGMKLRGHNFVWHRQLSSWFNSYVTKDNAREVLENHIRTVAARYKGRMQSWDVVNEAIYLEDNLPGGLRNSPWQKVLPGYIDIAFHTAREADPHALLIYNDYGVEGSDGASDAKRKAVLKLVTGMRERGVPIDGVGIQSHISAGTTYGEGLVGWMNKLSAANFKLLLTEMDVNDRHIPGLPIAARDAAVASTYNQYLHATLASPDVIALLTWGITDRYTWLNGEDSRTDGLKERCLPFDADLRPKLAFVAELQAVGTAPVRT